MRDGLFISVMMTIFFMERLLLIKITKWSNKQVEITNKETILRAGAVHGVEGLEFAQMLVVWVKMDTLKEMANIMLQVQWSDFSLLFIDF
jgi:hypothetical protein